MVCRRCGTEIADKALICFRCGAATTEARVGRPAGRPAVSRGPAILALLVLVVAALFMAQAATSAVPREFGYVLAAVAVAALGWQFLARRR